MFDKGQQDKTANRRQFTQAMGALLMSVITIVVALKPQLLRRISL